MKKIKNTLYAVLVVLTFGLLGSANGVNAQESTWVYDETDDLTHETMSHITQLNEYDFVDYDLQPQLGIEILNDLPEGYHDIDDYRTARFEELGVGGSDDTGVLYIMVINDRKFAIETGYGVEHVLTDLESKQILDKTIEDMKMYSETQEPEYLNNAVMVVANNVSNLMEMANTGELFEMREEQARQEELASQRRAETMRKGFTGIFSILGIGGVGMVGYKAIEERKRRKKLEMLEMKINDALLEFRELYDKDEVPFSDEMPYEVFAVGYKERYMESEEGDIEDSLNNKFITLNKIRVTNFKLMVENMTGLKYPKEFYISHREDFMARVRENEKLTVKEFTDGMDRKFDAQVEKRQEELNKLETELDSYLEGTELPEGVEERAIREEVLGGLRSDFNLNDSGVINLTIKETEEQKRRARMEYWFRYMLIRQVIQNKDEFRNKTYQYGSRSEFTEFAQKELAQSDTPTSRLVDNAVITTMLLGLAGTYLTKKERDYAEEQRRIAKQAEEEERRRRARARARSSSSSSSSSGGSSGGSFGSGFGGGRSGGGGASGGW